VDQKEYKRQYYLAHRGETLARAAKWNADNREKYLEKCRRYYQANKEKSVAQSKAWAAQNPEKRKAASTKYRTEKLDKARSNEAAYRARNRNACNARIKKWKAANPTVLLEYGSRRRAVSAQAIPPWANRSAIRALYRRAAELGQHVDHIVPLVSKEVCGLHCEANLQVLPGKDNLRKGNRHWPDNWDNHMEFRGELVPA
jgi:hypothetical protein